MSKNLFEPSGANDIFQRLSRLGPDSKPRWGKMTVSQMLAHCGTSFEVALGDKTLKRSWIGFLFGKMAKKQMVNEKPFKQNLPTAPEFLVKNDRNFEEEKQKLEVLIHRILAADKDVIASSKHPFFGAMTGDDWGVLGYKHLDHHLRQFGV